MASSFTGNGNKADDSEAAKQQMLPQDLFKPIQPKNVQKGDNSIIKPPVDAEAKGDPEENPDQENDGTGLVLTNCFKLAVLGEQRLSIGCSTLTDFFRGGFVPKKLYEIYGESGSGKTQFAIQILLQSLLPIANGGLEGQSLYLMTGKPLNEKRFNEIKENFLMQNKKVISED